ncbi:DUF1573 domain-containing protein [Labilibaculum sp. DW002]|uniref:DUF1573 domain-containing protein n=1 Tax=Paralabilibaculum antarcticum TaxID=2912572 RepID=A0ABT5VY66_9BACT|nr:DUF1573 domain-containing protein [Labilibaculum sp. DW002]MDE5420257.1 DUF1573 domain-containing protein [Labilibaculum sp. DW002]
MNRILSVNNLVFSFCLILSLCFSGCMNGENNKGEKELKEGEKSEQNILLNGYPKFEFTKEIHKFGKISQGEIVVHDFFFKNVGEKDLIITNIETSCGCAVAKWKKEPIKMGEESSISIEFNSKGRYGKQYKVITIFCNTLSGNKELKITAEVN